MLYFNSNIGTSQCGIGKTGSNAGSTEAREYLVSVFDSNKPLFSGSCSIFSSDYNKKATQILNRNYTQAKSINNSFVRIPKKNIF